MMTHAVIVGYGCVGYYRACALLSEGYQVTAFSRTQPTQHPKHTNFVHHCSDITKNLDLSTAVDLLYYTMPPPQVAVQDGNLSALLFQMSGYKMALIFILTDRSFSKKFRLPISVLKMLPMAAGKYYLVWRQWGLD